MSKIRFIIQVTTMVPGLVTGQRPPLLVTDCQCITDARDRAASPQLENGSVKDPLAVRGLVNIYDAKLIKNVKSLIPFIT